MQLVSGAKPGLDLLDGYQCRVYGVFAGHDQALNGGTFDTFAVMDNGTILVGEQGYPDPDFATEVAASPSSQRFPTIRLLDRTGTLLDSHVMSDVPVPADPRTHYSDDPSLARSYHYRVRSITRASASTAVVVLTQYVTPYFSYSAVPFDQTTFSMTVTFSDTAITGVSALTSWNDRASAGGNSSVVGYSPAYVPMEGGSYFLGWHRVSGSDSWPSNGTDPDPWTVEFVCRDHDGTLLWTEQVTHPMLLTNSSDQQHAAVSTGTGAFRLSTLGVFHSTNPASPHTLYWERKILGSKSGFGSFTQVNRSTGSNADFQGDICLSDVQDDFGIVSIAGYPDEYPYMPDSGAPDGKPMLPRTLGQSGTFESAATFTQPRLFTNNDYDYTSHKNYGRMSLTASQAGQKPIESSLQASGYIDVTSWGYFGCWVLHTDWANRVQAAAFLPIFRRGDDGPWVQASVDWNQSAGLIACLATVSDTWDQSSSQPYFNRVQMWTWSPSA